MNSKSFILLTVGQLTRSPLSCSTSFSVYWVFLASIQNIFLLLFPFQLPLSFFAPLCSKTIWDLSVLTVPIPLLYFSLESTSVRLPPSITPLKPIQFGTIFSLGSYTFLVFLLPHWPFHLFSLLFPPHQHGLLILECFEVQSSNFFSVHIHSQWFHPVLKF